MKGWMRRLRGAIGTGVVWAAAWAVGGILIGLASNLTPFLPWDRFFAVFDAPLPALAVPGFIGGVIFSLVLSIVGRRRRFDELSVPRFAAWGAAAGLVVGLVPITMIALGLATPREGLDVWGFTASISVPLMLLSAASAAGSLVLARRAEQRVSRGGLLDGGNPLATARAAEMPAPIRRDEGKWEP